MFSTILLVSKGDNSAFLCVELPLKGTLLLKKSIFAKGTNSFFDSWSRVRRILHKKVVELPPLKAVFT